MQASVQTERMHSCLSIRDDLYYKGYVMRQGYIVIVYISVAY